MPYKDAAKHKAHAKSYREKHKEEARDYARRYYQDHKEWHSIYAKKYYIQNKDAIIKRVSSHYDKNRAHRLAYHKQYIKRPDVVEKLREYRRLHGARCRALCIDHYSKGTNECLCCGEKEYVFLSIDHINGGGRRHRKAIARHLPQWLLRNNFPVGYRILCMNCNWALGILGYCPHNKLITPQSRLR